MILRTEDKRRMKERKNERFSEDRSRMLCDKLRQKKMREKKENVEQDEGKKRKKKE